MESVICSSSYTTKDQGDSAFQSVAPRLWNSLPSQPCLADSVDYFKKQLIFFNRLSTKNFIEILLLFIYF